MNLLESTFHLYLAKFLPIVFRMRWLRVGEKAWRDFWALLQVIHYSRYVSFFFFFGWGCGVYLLPCIDDPGLNMYISDWKQSALRFLTRPCLGQGAMGLSTDSLRWRNTRYLYFYYLSFTRYERGGRGGGFFSLSKLHLIDEMIRDVIFIVQSSNPRCSSLLTLFLHVVHFTLLPQFF